MTKLNWNRHATGSRLNTEYWSNPRKGFDSNFYKKKSRKIKHKLKKPNPHELCEVIAVRRPNTCIHYAQLRCVAHDVHIQWLNKDQYDLINKE